MLTQEDVRPALDEAIAQARANQHAMGLWQFGEALVDNPLSGGREPYPRLVSTCSSCSATITIVILDDIMDDPHGLAIDYPCPNVRT